MNFKSVFIWVICGAFIFECCILIVLIYWIILINNNFLFRINTKKFGNLNFTRYVCHEIKFILS